LSSIGTGNVTVSVASASGTFNIQPTGSLEVLPALSVTSGTATLAGDQTIADPASHAIGVTVTLDSLAVALMKPVSPGATQSYFALKASGSAALIGVTDVSLSGELTISVNRATDTALAIPSDAAVIDFAASATADPDGYGDATGLKVSTGPGVSDYSILDFTEKTLSVSGFVSVGISEFVFASGNFAFQQVPDSALKTPGTIKLAGGGTLTGASVLTIGANNVNAFVGANGPYWTQDLDGDGQISWAFETGTTDLSRTITSVTGATNGKYSVGQELPANTAVSMSAADGILGFGTGAQYGDLNGNGQIDANETAELNPSATGVALSIPSFAVALMRSQTGSFYAVQATGGAALLVGVPGVTLAANSINVQINGGSIPNAPANGPPPAVDFTQTFTDGTLSVPTSSDSSTTVSLGYSASTLSVSGALTLSIGDNVFVTGSMAFSKGQTVTATLSDGSTKSVSVVTLGASSVNIFLGAGGPAFLPDGSPDPIHPNAAGISLTGGTFGLALLTPTDIRDASRYYSVQGSASNISLAGISGLQLTVNPLNFRVNGGTDAIVPNRVVDFANSPAFASEELTLFDTNHDGKITLGELASRPGAAALSALNGVLTTDSAVVDHAALLNILDASGDKQISLAEAAVLLGGDSAALASASAADANGDGIIDPAGLKVATGGRGIILDSAEKVLEASGTVSLNLLSGLVVISGSVAIKISPEAIYLSDTSLVHINAVEIGVANGTVTINAGGQAASFTGLTLGLAYYTLDKTAPGYVVGDTRAWLGLKTFGGSVTAGSTSGISGGIENLTVSLNKGFGKNAANVANATAVDFKRTFDPGLVVDTGASNAATGAPITVLLDYDQAILSFSAKAYLNIGNFFFAEVTGGYTSLPDTLIHLVDANGAPAGTATVSVQIISATDGTVFAGNVGTIDSGLATDGLPNQSDPSRNADGTLNPTAVGFSLTGVNFVVVRMTDKTAGSGKVWTAVLATASSAALVGISGFDLSVNALTVQVNTGNAQANNTVVDFGASYAGNGGKLTVPLPAGGSTSSMEIAYARKVLQVEATATLSIESYVYVHGTFDFQSGDVRTLL